MAPRLDGSMGSMARWLDGLDSQTRCRWNTTHWSTLEWGRVTTGKLRLLRAGVFQSEPSL